jgi:hypothetical protein
VRAGGLLDPAAKSLESQMARFFDLPFLEVRSGSRGKKASLGRVRGSDVFKQVASRLGMSLVEQGIEEVSDLTDMILEFVRGPDDFQDLFPGLAVGRNVPFLSFDLIDLE